jgi:uncharacterized protein (TIGR04141 family)
VDADGPGVSASDVYEGPGFEAQAFLVTPPPHAVPWAAFLSQAFPELAITRTAAPSAVLVVKVDRQQQEDLVFAFSFGPAGRFLLRRDVLKRGFGLRTALNLIYPRAGGDGARLRAVDSKRRGQTIVRSRSQASSQAEFEVFDVNQLQDVLGKAIGVPADATWGPRVSGGDALSLSLDLAFNELGHLCENLHAAFVRDDYRQRFAWIDHVQPIDDPSLVDELQSQVLERISSKELDALQLAPPEIVDWEQVTHFRYHFDRKRRGGGSVLRPDLRIQDYVSGLETHRGLEGLDVEDLRRAAIYAVDGDENERAKWSVWRCLTAEFQVGGTTYLLDEGEFFIVSDDYLSSLNDFIAAIPLGSAPLPETRPSVIEERYNQEASVASDDLLLLDRKTVRVTDRATAVEICDLLSKNKQLIHVKRHLGSSDLSHLFAQGVVSAELLQSSVEFRRVAADRIAEAASGRAGFDFVSEGSITTSDFEIVYAIAARWNGRTFTDALPFFSKVNLREAATNLTSRGFNVAVQQIRAE